LNLKVFVAGCDDNYASFKITENLWILVFPMSVWAESKTLFVLKPSTSLRVTVVLFSLFSFFYVLLPREGWEQATEVARTARQH